MPGSRRVLVSVVTTCALVLSGRGVARAQGTAADCQPYTLQGTVFECAAEGSPLSQLRTGTFIAGSEAAGETLARAIALEVATAPFGSSSGGFTFTFDPSTRSFSRRAGTFGPAFSERAVTIGKGKLSGGFNFLYRSYDRMDSLALGGFDVFRFQGGTLPVTSSRFELETHTNTLAGFADYGVLDNLDVGVLVPYVRISVNGVSRIYGQSNDELQRVLLNASATGLGDVAIFGKYRFWTLEPVSSASEEVPGGLAAGVTVRVPTGNADNLVGLGVTRTLFSLIGSATMGRVSPHVNVGYEAWSGGVAIPKDFQGLSTITARDQAQYSGGLEYEVHPQLSLMVDVLGRYLRGAGRVGYQPFAFPQNFANVSGAEALVAVPSGANTVLLAPGAKWNIFKSALLTMNVLVSVTDTGLRTRVTPVVGIDWGF